MRAMISVALSASRRRRATSISWRWPSIAGATTRRRTSWAILRLRFGMRRDGGKKIVLANIQDPEVGGGTWCDDAHDFAANEFLPGTGVLHLVADGDFEAGAN